MKDLNAWIDIPLSLGPAVRRDEVPKPNAVDAFERGNHEPIGDAPVRGRDESDHAFHVRTSGTPDAVCTHLNSVTPGVDEEEPSTVPAWLMTWQLSEDAQSSIRMKAPYFR